MAIITCPSCKERISNLNKTCPHCNYALDKSAEGLSLGEARGRITRKRKANLEMQSYAALLVFVAGIAWIWFGGGGSMRDAPTASIFVTAGAALWYVVIRILMIWPKLKKL